MFCRSTHDLCAVCQKLRRSLFGYSLSSSGFLFSEASPASGAHWANRFKRCMLTLQPWFLTDPSSEAMFRNLHKKNKLLKLAIKTHLRQTSFIAHRHFLKLKRSKIVFFQSGCRAQGERVEI